jgi:hypothetical protein
MLVALRLTESMHFSVEDVERSISLRGNQGVRVRRHKPKSQSYRDKKLHPFMTTEK